MVPAMQRGEHHLTLRGLESACAREELETVVNINNKDKGVGARVDRGVGVGGWRVSDMEEGRAERLLRQG